ncbi:hypothetical protein C0991_002643 [Blastosporella zonata]|nr:hypothetical protein C0991_002643 [Blastosporella zonata]
MVKVGMDTDSPGNHAGYDADPQFNVTGFSQLHDDGTGGSIPLSNFKIWAFPQCSSFETCQTSLNSRKILRKVLPDGSPDDFASPGYFSTNLTNALRVELTATRRTALHRYTFPPGTTNPRIMLDLTNDGQHSSTDPVLTLDPDTGKLEGGASFAASFGPGRYQAFTCVTFKGDGYDLGKPTEYGIWLGNFPVRGTTNILQLYYGFVSEMGGLLTFPPAPNGGKTTILVRVGVSFISSAQACANAEEEVPDFDFESVEKAARAEWNELLGRIQVDPTGVDTETVQLFYSSLYRTHISPADYGDPILGEFFVKFHDHAADLDVNVDDLYNALLADAENEPPNWNLQGRQANAWKQFSGSTDTAPKD